MPGRLRDPGPGVKDARLYEALREDGNSKEKAARIANAAARTSPRASHSAVGHKDGRSGDYEEWTVTDLRRKAAEIGIAGRARMRKSDLISALRGH